MRNNEYDCPVEININGIWHKIRNKCDYRVVLDCIGALTDVELSIEDRLRCALYIFFEDVSAIEDYDEAIEKMYEVIGYGETKDDNTSPSLMNWKKDFISLVAPVNRILGYEVRTPNRYTHWWTFVSAYLEIGECAWSTVVAIRNKKLKHKPLSDWEKEYYRNNKNMIDIGEQDMTDEEREFLSDEW